jgi:bacterioferritin-associated ferredoxin
MILCSCNVLSDREIQAALASGGRPSVGGLFRSLGCEAKCGRCARSIAAAIDGLGRAGDEACAGEGCESCHAEERAAA